MYQHMRIRTSRMGFTLIELLVVIAIIGILVAMVATGVFSVRKTQEVKTTEGVLQQIGSGLDQQLKAVIDKASDDAKNNGIHPQMLTDALRDSRRAKVLWTKLMIRREFPTTFAEARTTYPLYGFNTFPAQFATLPTTTTLSPEEQSAICLYLTLSTSRRGMSMNPESAVGPTGIKTIQSGSASFKVFKDGWDQAIGFVRVPTDQAILNELDSLSDKRPDYRDPVDPEGLLNHGWTLPALGSPLSNVLRNPGNWFEGRNYLIYAYSLGIDASPNLANGDGDDLFSFRVRKVGQRGGE